MVKIEDDLRRKVERLVAAAHGEIAQPASGEEENTLDESEIPDELIETQLPGFQMTYHEMKKAVGKYSEWLSEVNNLISEKEHEIRILTEEFEELTGEAREQVAYELQMANDDYENYQEERDEVRAKLQILRKKKAKAEREIRRNLREQVAEAVDWEKYDSQEARERDREKRVERQKQLQGVRAAKRDVDRETETERPDMSAVKEIAGEEKAKMIQDSITSDLEFNNEWLQDGKENNDDEDLQELL